MNKDQYIELQDSEESKVEETYSDISRILDEVRGFQESMGTSKNIKGRETSFGFRIDKTYSLLEYNPREHSFVIFHSAAEWLSSLKGPCYIMSVSGSPLVGKSSMLNLIVSFFARTDSIARAKDTEVFKYHNIYEIGDGKKSTTQGIDMFCVTVGGQHLIILDVEGDNDPHRKSMGTWIYTNLILTALSVSHVHVYNYNLLLQQNFLDYFRSIDKIIRENKLHENFQTHLYFAKKNYNYSTEEDFKEDYEEMLEYLKENIEEIKTLNVDDPLYIFKIPPQHITCPKMETSCLKKGYICKECQEDPFFVNLKKFFNNMVDVLNKETPYNNGQEVLQAIQKILAINKRDLPFVADMGYLGKIRLEKLRANQERLHKQLYELSLSHCDKELVQFIDKTIANHPNAGDAEFLKNFDALLSNIITKVLQMEFMIPELSKFIENLMDPAYTILNQEEKEVLMNTYVEPFRTATQYLIENSKDYIELVERLILSLRKIKIETQLGVDQYLEALKEQKNVKKLILPAVTTGVLGLAARQIGVRIFANFLLGGGVVGAVLTAYTVYSVKKKIDECKKNAQANLELNKITGIENEQEAEEALKNTEAVFNEIIHELELRHKTLTDLSEKDAKRNFAFIANIEEICDKKIAGIALDEIEDKVKLIQGMKIVKGNAERFKKCI